jgi:hypothetical protein
MPFFAIGYWPPFFYVLEAAWMALFGYHRDTVLLLPALLAALLSGTIFWLLKDRLAPSAAFLAGCLLLLTPAMLWSSGLIMVDITFALFCFWTALAFARWVDTGSARAALLTGLMASISLLTKINAIHLILLPVFVLLITGRWRLVLRSTFWLIPAVMAVLWGPWMLYARKFVNIGFGGLFRPDVPHIAIGAGRALFENLGWLLIPILAGGVIALRKARFDTSALVCAMLPVCYLVFLLAARVDIEGRFLVPILAPSMVLVGISLGALSERFARTPVPRNRLETALVGVILVACAATLGRRIPTPPTNQVRPVVEFIRGRGGPEDASILVPSDAEGPFIAELASDEKRRPLRFMIRPNKLLAIIDWNGGSYQARFQTPEEMISLFDRLPVRYTVIAAQMDNHTRAHDRLLRRTLDTHPERWSPLKAPPGPWLVYERIDGRAVETAQTVAILRQYLNDRLLAFSPGP